LFRVVIVKKGGELMIQAAKNLFQEDSAALAIQINDNVPSGATRGAHYAASDVRDDPRTAHVWLDAGLSRPSFRGLDTITDRALCGWLILISACVSWAAILVVTGSKLGPMDATAQMEMLAKKLERTAVIPSETASEIARVIGQPWYDCGHVACSAQLEERNRAVRAKLSDLLATKERSNDLNASQKGPADSASLSQ
jgi:hypothetical protein